MNLYGCHAPKTEQDGSIKYDRYVFSREGWDYTQTKNEETGEEIKVPAMDHMFLQKQCQILN